MSEKAAQAFIQEVWGLQGAAYLVVCVRYYQQISTHGLRSISGDDVLMFIATLVYTAESVAAYYVVAYWKGLANNGMTDEQRASLDPSSPEWQLRVNGSKTHVIGLLLYATLLWLLKGCWIFYYDRLTDGVRQVRRLVVWGRFIIPITYVSCLLVAFLKCIPFQKQWQINPNPGNSCSPAISYIQTIYVMALNSCTDLYLMAIPLPMIWKANMPWKKKVSLLIMFSGGFLELAFGVLRCVAVLTVGNKDPSQSGYWSVRESFVSFVLTNMPMVYPLLKRFIDKSRSATSRRTGMEGSHSYQLDSHPGHSRVAGSKGGITASQTTNDAAWDSKEHIIAGSETKSGSDGYEASLPDSDKTMPLPLQGTAHPGVGEVPSSLKARNQGRSSRGDVNDQIVVTTEYTVSVVPEQGQGPGGSSKFRAW